MAMKKSIPALVLCAVALGGCTTTLSSMKNGYHLLQMVMLAPVNEAVYRQATGAGFYDHFADSAYRFTRIAPFELCTEATLRRDIEDRVVHCSVAGVRYSDDCNDKISCGQIELSPAVLADPALREAALAALKSPCSHLSDPRALKWGAYQSNLGTTAEWAWKTFKCDRRRPALFDVTLYGTVAQAQAR